jgi:EmrB/QacA subfamily drug resistance transporter
MRHTEQWMTRTQRWTMVAAVLGSAIVFLDGTIVNVALPVIGRELKATLVSTLEGQTYVSSGYLATLAALLVLAGALGDYFGRRKIFAIGLAGFGATSVLCGLAPNLELLALFRVVQGAAGALLVPGALSIITATFEGPARARAFGIWASATSATTILGPLIGGALVESISWRTAFLINVPLVILALYATIRYMSESRDETATGRFDWLGALVAALAIGGLSFGLIRGQEHQWQDAVAFVAIAVGVVALVAFPILMAVRPHPLVPLGLFRIRNFAVINLATLVIYSALYVNLTFQSLFLQGTLGYSPVASGAVGLPVGILLTVLSTRVGSISGRIGARPFLVAGPLIMAAGLFWLARIPSTSQPWTIDVSNPSTYIPPVSTLVDLLPAILLFGVGISLVVAPLTSTLMSSIPVRNAGLGSAINNALSRVGTPIVLAIIFIVVTSTFYASLAAKAGVDAASSDLRSSVAPLNPPPPGTSAALQEAVRLASTDAFHLAALVAAALLIIGAAVNFFGLREGSKARVGAAAAKADAPAGAPVGADAEPKAGASAGAEKAASAGRAAAPEAGRAAAPEAGRAAAPEAGRAAAPRADAARQSASESEGSVPN